MHERVEGWADGWMAGWMDERVERSLVGGHIGRRRKKKKEGWVDGGGWKDGWHISKRAHKQEGI